MLHIYFCIIYENPNNIVFNTYFFIWYFFSKFMMHFILYTLHLTYTQLRSRSILGTTRNNLLALFTIAFYNTAGYLAVVILIFFIMLPDFSFFTHFESQSSIAQLNYEINGTSKLSHHWHWGISFVGLAPLIATGTGTTYWEWIMMWVASHSPTIYHSVL